MELNEFCNKLENKYKKIEKAIDWKRFKELWKNDANMYEFYEFANEIHKKVFGKGIDLKQFEKGWSYRVVLHPDYKQAKIEFINLILGWY